MTSLEWTYDNGFHVGERFPGRWSWRVEVRCWFAPVSLAKPAEPAIKRPTHPPDTGGITATSSPPLRTNESRSWTNSASTLHRLCSRTRSIPLFGCRDTTSFARSESFNPSSGTANVSEVRFVAVVAAAK